MTRIVQRPIHIINLTEFGVPISFEDKGIIRTVVILIDSWRESGNWIAGEDSRQIYRVMTDNDATLDLQEQGGQWTIYKVHD